MGGPRLRTTLRGVGSNSGPVGLSGGFVRVSCRGIGRLVVGFALHDLGPQRGLLRSIDLWVQVDNPHP